MDQTVSTTLLCSAAAFVASAINAVAGGGTFLTFPTLTGFAGLTEKAANITSTIGIWPGAASSVVAAKQDFTKIPRAMLIQYSIISTIGGIAGALLLRYTSPQSFKFAIPFLLLAATLIFTFGKSLAVAAHRCTHRVGGLPMLSALIQLLIAIYGGYFGAGIGVLMLAGLSIGGIEDLRVANAMKVALSTLINAIAVAIFLSSPEAHWNLIWPMAITSMIGGFVGMMFARKIPQTSLRILVIAIGTTLTLVYFYRGFR